jgi:hypothetical protein
VLENTKKKKSKKRSGMGINSMKVGLITISYCTEISKSFFLHLLL